MARTLQDKLAALDPARRAGIEAEAARLHTEYLTLQELRKAKALTQVQLAETLGIQQATVAKYERQSDLLLSTLTSYVRARAESLGIECTVGWISRTERVFIMGILLVVHLPELMAYVLALATCFTAGQRILHVRHALAHGARSTPV